MASALKDAELKIEAGKRSYELDPVGGDDMQRLAKEVMSQPRAVLERMKKVLGEYASVPHHEGREGFGKKITPNFVLFVSP